MMRYAIQWKGFPADRVFRNLGGLGISVVLSASICQFSLREIQDWETSCGAMYSEKGADESLKVFELLFPSS